MTHDIKVVPALKTDWRWAAAAVLVATVVPAALIFLTPIGLLGSVAWLAGLALVWASVRPSVGEKLVIAFAFPVAVAALMFAGGTSCQTDTDTDSHGHVLSSTKSCDAGAGGSVGVPIALGGLPLVGLIVAFRLRRRRDADSSTSRRSGHGM